MKTPDAGQTVTLNPNCRATFNSDDGWRCDCEHKHPLVCSKAAPPPESGGRDRHDENIRRAAERGLAVAQKRGDSAMIDQFQHILNLWHELALSHPAGVVVPREPTMEMLVAAAHCLDGRNLLEAARCPGERRASKESIRVYKARKRWEAMLAAAPSNSEREAG